MKKLMDSTPLQVLCWLYKGQTCEELCRQQSLLLNFLSLQMSAQNWIQIALLGLLIVHNVASQTCSTPFDAVFAGVTDITLPDSVLVLADPQMTFYRDLVGFTDQQTEQVMQSALEHFNTQFGLDFSNIQPDSNNVRYFENANFGPGRFPVNETIVSNRWIVNGNTRSRCYTMNLGYFSVNFNGTQTLYGRYGGQQGISVVFGDLLVYGHAVISGPCSQEPLLFQIQTDIPSRRTPVEAWLVQDLRAYHRQLGQGRMQFVFKSTAVPGAAVPTTAQSDTVVISFP